MKNNNESLLRIGPVEEYCAPEIPKLKETRDKSALLKKLPLRWQRNAKVVACIGLAGTLTLSGCAHYLRSQINSVDNIEHSQESGYESFQNNGTVNGGYNGQSGRDNPRNDDVSNNDFNMQNKQEEFDLLVKLHTGGAASTNYVVHMTEQEVIGIIRNLLEAEGLNFDATLPENIVDFGDRESPIDIVLFDQAKGVAILDVGFLSNNRRFCLYDAGRADDFVALFSEQTNDITFGAFHIPLRNLGYAHIEELEDGEWSWIEPSDEEVAESRPILEERLVTQVQGFIAFLQSEGILPTQDVKILLNGVPIEFESMPVVLNNCIMVPMHTLFMEVGMEVSYGYEYDVGGRLGRIVFAGKDGLNIRLFRHIIRVNDERVELDTPIIINNDKMLIPLMPIAEAIGATVDWDRETNIVNIILS